MVKMRRVKSKNIRAIGYEPDPAECELLGTMYVEFVARPGVVYSCRNVPVELNNELVRRANTNGVESVGSYFAKHIRPFHKFVVSSD